MFEIKRCGNSSLLVIDTDTICPRTRAPYVVALVGGPDPTPREAREAQIICDALNATRATVDDLC